MAIIPKKTPIAVLIHLQGRLCGCPDSHVEHPAGGDRAAREAEDHGREQQGGQAQARPLQARGHRHHHLRGKQTIRVGINLF